jgi:hypothetical protein
LQISLVDSSTEKMWVMTSVETLGYSHPSLRDEQDQILVALDIPVCRVADIPVGRLLTTISFVRAKTESKQAESPAIRQTGMSALR